MRLGVIPENLIERIVLAAGVAPTPLVDTHMAFTLAQTIMVGTKLGVFEVLASEALTAGEVATRCQTHSGATEKLLNALAGAGYLRADGERYALKPVARKWLLKESPQSLIDKILFQFLEWHWVEHYEDFIRNGEPLNAHATMSDDEWGVYQRGMRSVAGICASEVARRTPVPKDARDMIDIGGSHGYFSVALCRRYQGLRAVVLDLPEAVKHAAPILAKEGMGDRVVHRAGNVLTDDLGTEAWDLVFIALLVHHFDDPTNRELARRVARALRPGGVFVIQDFSRPHSPKEAGQTGALLDLYFALTSAAGTWSFKEMANWQREAGLVPQKPIWFHSVPGIVQQAAVKPAT